MQCSVCKVRMVSLMHLLTYLLLLLCYYIAIYRLDTPLVYEHGWGKRLSYIIAADTHTVTDVTPRYTRRYHNLLIYDIVTCVSL
jgi:Rad4 transglutaminase-like domain